MVSYTCRYSSGHLIPLLNSHAGVGDHPCFLTFYNCKITNFSLYFSTMYIVILHSYNNGETMQLQRISVVLI